MEPKRDPGASRGGWRQRCTARAASLVNRRAGVKEEVDNCRSGTDPKGTANALQHSALAVIGLAVVVGLAAEAPLRGAEEYGADAGQEPEGGRAIEELLGRLAAWD